MTTRGREVSPRAILSPKGFEWTRCLNQPALISMPLRPATAPAHPLQILSFALHTHCSDVSIGVIEYEATIPYARFFIPSFGAI